MTATVEEHVQAMRDAALVASRVHNPEIQHRLDSAKHCAALLAGRS